MIEVCRDLLALVGGCVVAAFAFLMIWRYANRRAQDRRFNR
jgi:hypothetical protein